MPRHPFWDRHAPLRVVTRVNLSAVHTGVPCPPLVHPSAWPAVAELLALSVPEVASVVSLRAGLVGDGVCPYGAIPLSVSFLDACGPEALRRAVAVLSPDVAKGLFTQTLPSMPASDAQPWRTAHREWHDLVQLAAPESLLYEVTRQSVERFLSQLRGPAPQPSR